ncbi:LysR family transcriptional regulator [Comamonas aquatica]|uniref:LysR family transcriptional regulator n=1 Tax=Comamonas aquatica TaxID=225991 RepID=A0AA42W6L2_9BURK|nr:LysR family transcriptional regulator [Comamonas aquatica]MDH1428421.1 LysR family transcriptional regulator [Comamonas aquatica]MDH1607671.1 LysR family transcriptional regulator [Comamonas aquatica]MDH1619427.1 LysR family transcriptional regulator [Comamonas aquatica]MDH2007413.1 LysR family transcriptional regulator [Comamonas aquatica]
MHIHARTLKYFDMIKRCNSIREAARHLHVSASAVNRQLLQLEEEIGSPLFDRMTGGLRLTAVGELFARHVTTVLQDQNRLVSELDALRGIRRGELKIAAVEGVNADVLPNVLETMATRYPLVKIAIVNGGSSVVAQAVADGDADIALGYNVQRSELLRQYAVGRFHLGAIMRAEHPLSQRKSVTFAECARYPLILPGTALSTYEQMRPVLMNHKRPLTVVMESASIELARTMAIRGLGLAFQTRIGIEKEMRDGTMVHLPLAGTKPILSELGVYARDGRWLPPAMDALLRVLSDELARREAEEVRS